MRPIDNIYFKFCLIILLLVAADTLYAADLQVGGDLASQQYDGVEDIVTLNPCVVNSGVQVVFATDNKVILNKGFVIKTGGTLMLTALDDDGLPNIWEMTHFGNLNATPDDDPDNDGLTNLMELQINTSPVINNIASGKTFPDTDNDDMSDVWELIRFGNLEQEAQGDQDNDGFINIVEFTEVNDILYIEGTLRDLSEGVYEGGNIITKGPTNVPVDNNETLCQKKYAMKLTPGFSVETGTRFTIKLMDNDGLSNAWETYYFGDLTQTAEGDFDGDGLSNSDELKHRTHPDKKDTDGDGMNDLVEILLETSPLDPDSKPVPGNYYEYDAIGRVKWMIRVQ